MAINLTQSWIQHAFPDDHPAKEQLWADAAERRRVQDRHDLNLEQSGSDLKIRRFTGERQDELNGKGGRGRTADDMMMLAVGAHRHENWDNPVTVAINGEDRTFTQGQWHSIAKRYRDKKEQDYEDAVARGASPEEQARLKRLYEGADRLVTRTGARDWTGDDLRAIRDIGEEDPDFGDAMEEEARLGRDPDNNKTGDAKISQRMNHDARENEFIDEWGRAGGRTATFAGTIDHAADSGTEVSLTAKFVARAENAPAADTHDDRPAPADPRRTTGLDI